MCEFACHDQAISPLPFRIRVSIATVSPRLAPRGHSGYSASDAIDQLDLPAIESMKGTIGANFTPSGNDDEADRDDRRAGGANATPAETRSDEGRLAVRRGRSSIRITRLAKRPAGRLLE